MKKHLFLKIFILLIVIIGLIIAYSHFIATQMITLHEYKITNQILLKTSMALKFFILRTFTMEECLTRAKLDRLVKSINEQEPDIVVLTGDLIDKDTRLTTSMIDELANGLKKIKANIAKYAITGNHDYKFDEWQNIIENGGFEKSQQYI